uniref:DUF2255 family protein n=1 Tax=Paractinoplanes polyasparticus TaxID=2856853 RepID=UPI001C85F7CE|nr:DUF2255 family protein [Actinoplanes polyasparticus]
MTTDWPPEDLRRIDDAVELEIAVRRSDGSLARRVPIWVVCAGGRVFVRTWHRRQTGWYGGALRTRQARIRVPGLETEVVIDDLGYASAPVTAEVDAAYRRKYGPGAESMVTADATASTLELIPY